MKVLVVGQGGREHALVKALSSAPSVSEVHALPGSAGIAREPRTKCHSIDWKNFDEVRTLLKQESIDLVVVGPEVPLAEGLSDSLRAHGHSVFGPSQEAARLESSKIYAKEFLTEAKVTTARSFVVARVDETLERAKVFAPPYVLKADGLAGGKGVFICKTIDELREAARSIFEDRSLGDAGDRALLEEFQPGYEISYLVLTDGESYEPLKLAQDHKRLGDGDQGPNTGGMGVVAPMEIDSALRNRIDREILEPSIAHLKTRGLLYRGVLYVGLMITKEGPSVLEFNVRFGDPEAQALLPLLDGDWGRVFADLAKGKLTKLEWKSQACCCVVLAAGGYPDSPAKGAVIEGVEEAEFADGSGYLIHAGTQHLDEKGWVVAGGRVLNAIGNGATIQEAIEKAYQVADRVQFVGKQMRKDIGAKLT
jgi:phosphoribosylamine---glycine ligase